jgi:hypothetical protein
LGFGTGTGGSDIFENSANAVAPRNSVMEILVFYPSDTQPKRRYFDGPIALGMQQAVGEHAEAVPGLTSISRDGLIFRCVAYCDGADKQSGQPVNAWATALWHTALKREGHDRGLRRTDGTIIDWLVGNVAVICSPESIQPK